jgi:ATP-dependent helicase/DNAse subunit B
MIISYLRSSSLGTLEMCEMKYFFQYVLGMKDKTNKKAVLGTIVHRTMQVLADKKRHSLIRRSWLRTTIYQI